MTTERKNKVVSQEELCQHGFEPGEVEVLVDAIGRGVRLREEAKRIKETSEANDAIIKAMMESHPGIAPSVPGVATITMIPGKNVTIGREPLKMALLDAGLDADQIEKVLASASKTTVYTQIRFTVDE